MGFDTKVKEVGGGPAVGLADDFTAMLRQGLFGSFGAPTAGARMNGANPFGSTQGIAGVLGDLLAGGAGTIGGNMSDMISKQGERDVAGLRARFGAAGGMGFGTPAAFGEAMLRSETAPKITQAVGGLQINALAQLLPILASLSGRGISQRETIAQPGALTSAIGTIAPIAGTIGGMMVGGPAGAAAGASLGSSFSNMGNFQKTPAATAQQWTPTTSPGGITWDPSVFQLPSWSPTWSLN